jgi:hypothetical protein
MTMAFNPKKSAQEGGTYQGLPPDDYLLAIVDFERVESKNGRPYLKTKTKVISGPAKNKTFRDRLMVPRMDRNGNVHADDGGIAGRFGSQLMACGWEDDIDPASDRALREALIGKPFKARVKRKVSDGWVDNEVERYLTGDKITEDEASAMADWAESFASNAPEAPPEEDDVPPPDDSDIPF